MRRSAVVLHNGPLSTMASAPRPIDKPRPVYLNLFAIRQPIPAIVSILHRVSGALLFLVGIPLGLWALQTSLLSPEGFGRVHDAFTSPFAKLVVLVLAWSFFPSSDRRCSPPVRRREYRPRSRGARAARPR
jgi:hypothetical protein